MGAEGKQIIIKQNEREVERIRMRWEMGDGAKWIETDDREKEFVTFRRVNECESINYAPLLFYGLLLLFFLFDQELT